MEKGSTNVPQSKTPNLHWVNHKEHICKYCGQNLLSPYTTSECPKVRPERKPVRQP